MSAVSITNEVLQEVIQHSLEERPFEGCGLIIGKDGVGTRTIRMRNVHPAPGGHYRMNEMAVLETVKGLDDTGEDIIAAYHSHPRSAAILSDVDVAEAKDLNVAYIVVGLADPKSPKVRAWRVEMPFIGERRRKEVVLHVTSSGEAWTPAPPELPWALCVGNKVRVTYYSHQTKSERQVTGIVRERDGDRVHLDVTMKASVNSLVFDRIRKVEVIREGDAARELRRAAVQTAKHVAAAVNGGEIEGVEELTHYVACVFPKDIPAVTVEA